MQYLKCGVSFRSSHFIYIPASRSARLMKSSVKSSQYHLTTQRWKTVVCTASRELWGWYPDVAVMSVAKQVAILPLPCIKKKQVWVFSLTPEKAKASWDVGCIWALWSNKWNRDGNCSLCYTADLRILSSTDGHTGGVHESWPHFSQCWTPKWSKELI